MVITIEKHQQDIKKFASEVGVFEIFAEVLYKILNNAGKLYAPLSIVQTRPKNISSFAEKIIRKNKYKDPLRDMTDLCGGRIITHTQEQALKICSFIKENFLIDEANSLDVGDRLRTGEFGYRSVHYIVTPVKDEILGIKIPDELKDKKAEIQVRTLLQHTWADVLHDRLYKTAIKIPKEWERDSARLAALLEDADDNISRITSLTDYYTANYGNSMNSKALQNEIEILNIILESDPVVTNKPVVALKIARLLKFSGNWDAIIEILKKYEKIESKVQNLIQAELGYAICKKYKGNPQSQLYKSGVKYLLGAAYLKESKSSYTFSKNSLSEETTARCIAIQYLAEIHENLNDVPKTRDLFNLAYQLDSDNPYTFAKILEYNPQYCDHNLLLQNNIKHSIDICSEHIRLGVESIKAYFTIGRLNIINDNYDGAINSFLKAIDLFVSDSVCISEDIYDAELNSLSRLKNIKKSAFEIEWIETMLLLAITIKENNQSYLKALKKKSKPVNSIQMPVLIVAGGADKLPESSANKYSSYLIEAVRRYEGTIISGGTTIGIPGLLGSAVEIARKIGNKKINLIGYVPKKNVKNVKTDKNYKLILTGGEEFSYWESICMWHDLILSGIKPGDVSVLGIDGGKIASFEYRLALALGSQMGIVKASGRAAEEIIKDNNWNCHKCLHIIPDEPESVWGFVNRRISTTFSLQQLEDTAKVIHESYVADQLKSRRDEQNLKPWSGLNNDFKESNLSQAKFIIEILTLAGFGIRKTINNTKGIIKFSEKDILKMSKLEHGRWVAERLLIGWKYGSKKDINNRISPFLVTWDELSPDVQKYDTNTIENYSNLLKSAGYEIFRLDE